MDIRKKTEKKVFSYIEEHCMIAPYDRIVVGVSGGADSVCLLFLLLEYAKNVPLSLAVVHVNHGIRSDAEEDARYVEDLCVRAEIPCYLTSVDIHKLAMEGKCSEEDAGRRVRYQAFREAAEKIGGTKIAVAHNSDDNAETMLFHLFRGSGIKGLCGIAPVREESVCRADMGPVDIIRPVLCLRRQEIEAYLQERQIAWRIDSTNGGDDYIRNRIRHHILPYAEQEITAGTVEHMCQTADILRETEEFLEQQTKEALRHCLISSEQEAAWRGQQDCSSYRLAVESFRLFSPVLQKRMLYTLAKRLSPTGKDISLVHIKDMLSLFAGEGNRSISLPFGMTARRQYGEVALERKGKADDRDAIEALWTRQPVMVPGAAEGWDSPFVYDLGELGKISFKFFLIQKGQKVPKNRYTKWFDYDKIEESLTIRSRCAGDFFTIIDGAGEMRHQSLKAYMITEKIPRQLRDHIPVVAAGSHILWLVGGRISEYYKVDGNTQHILQVTLDNGCRGSETEEENVRTH